MHGRRRGALIDEGSRDKAFANMIAKRGDVPEEL